MVVSRESLYWHNHLKVKTAFRFSTTHSHQIISDPFRSPETKPEASQFRNPYHTLTTPPPCGPHLPARPARAHMSATAPREKVLRVVVVEKTGFFFLFALTRRIKEPNKLHWKALSSATAHWSSLCNGPAMLAAAGEVINQINPSSLAALTRSRISFDEYWLEQKHSKSYSLQHYFLPRMCMWLWF